MGGRKAGPEKEVAVEEHLFTKVVLGAEDQGSGCGVVIIIVDRGLWFTHALRCRSR